MIRPCSLVGIALAAFVIAPAAVKSQD